MRYCEVYDKVVEETRKTTRKP